MKLSARNQLKGKVLDVKKAEVAARVRVDIGGQTITAAVLAESVDDLGIGVGDEVSVVIKSTDIMLAK
jgi:molybdopterin-binding protein